MSRDLINAIRRNHALEHAAIAVLLKRPEMDGINLVGRATFDGFYIYGNIPTETVAEVAKEGLVRLQKGERQLAVSPFCGTNMAVASTMAGVAALIAVGKENRLRRLPTVITAITMAMIAAQPLGRMVQQHLTTSVAGIEHLHVERISHRGWGGLTRHKIKTIMK
jgi:hypothetical protein